MSPLSVYLITRLDAISASLVFCTIISMVLLIMSACHRFSDVNSDDKEGISNANKFIKISATISIIFAVLAMLTPNSKQAAAIVIIPKIANEENIDFIKGESHEVYQLFKNYVADKLSTEKE